MGIFSRKTKVHIQSIAQRMTQDQDFAYSSKQALSQYLWGKQGKLNIDLDGTSLSDYYIQASQSALPNQWHKAYHYAHKKKYHYGLPTTSVIVNPEHQLLDILINYLQLDTSDILFSNVSSVDYHYLVWDTLINQYQYNSRDNTLIINNEPVYLDYVDLFLINPVNDEQTTLSFDFNECYDRPLDITRLPKDTLTADTNQAIIHYTFKDENNVQVYDKFELTFDNYREDKDWLYCTYKKDNQYHWFSYELFSGNFEIDSAFRLQTQNSQFYPRLYVRLNQKDIADITDTTIKKSVKRLYQRLGMDIKDITKNMVQSIGQDNYPDVHGLYIFNGVAINKHNSSMPIAEYCFRYFKRLYDVYDGKGLVQDISDNTSTQTLKFDRITYEKVTGTYENLKPKEYKLQNVGTVITGITTKWIADLAQSVSNDISYHKIIAQYDGHYELLTVYNLSQYVSLSGSGANHAGLDENLVIPIDRLLINDLTQKEKELLFHQSLHIQIMLVKVTKQKWYETLGFQLVLAVVAAALTYAFAPAGTKFSALLKAMATNVIKGFAINMAVNLALQQAVKLGLIDPKYVGIIHFLISVGTMAYRAGFDLSKLTSAPNLIRLTNSAFDMYSKYQQAQIHDVHRQQQELMLLQQNRQEILNQAQKLLDTKVFTPSQELLKSSFSPNIDLFETPEIFYNRLQVLDVNELSLVSVYNYIEFVNQKSQQLSLYHTKDELDFILL